jgi:hypothetical protein
MEEAIIVNSDNFLKKIKHSDLIGLFPVSKIVSIPAEDSSPEKKKEYIYALMEKKSRINNLKILFVSETSNFKVPNILTQENNVVNIDEIGINKMGLDNQMTNCLMYNTLEKEVSILVQNLFIFN